jgi:hypothetical protein
VIGAIIASGGHCANARQAEVTALFLTCGPTQSRSLPAAGTGQDLVSSHSGFAAQRSKRTFRNTVDAKLSGFGKKS